MGRHGPAALLLGSFLAMASPAAAVPFDPAPMSRPIYDVAATPEVHRVPAGDGALIYTETYLPRPSAAGRPPTRLPTVLAMTPYENIVASVDRRASSALRLDIEHFVRRGYAYTVAHVYGTGRSEGCLDVYGRREVDATARVVEFLGERAAWSNGSVGMYGLSYPGETQIAVAALGDRDRIDSLKAIVPNAAATGFYDSYAGFDGVPFVAGDTQNYAFYDVLTNLPTGEPPRVQRVPCASTALAASGRRTGDFTTYDAEREFRRGARRVRTPILLARGLLDRTVHPIGDAGFLDRLPPSTPRAVILGQWGHVFPDEGGRADWLDTATAWYDRWLKRLPTGAERWPAVQVQDTAGRWRTERDWPDTGGTRRALELGAGGTLGGGAAGGSTVVSDSTTVDSPDAARFQTPPLTQPLHLTGQPVVDLWLVTDRADAHIGVRLEALDREGKPVTTAQMSGMRSLQHLDPLTDGRFEQSVPRPAPTSVPLRVPVRLVPLDVTVPTGGRLRLTIAGVTDWDVSGVPQTGAPSGAGARLTLLHDQRHRGALRFSGPGPTSRPLRLGSCLSRRSPIGRRNVGRIRLGLTRRRLLGLPVAPARRTPRSYRYCVKGSRGRVTAVFSSRSRRARVRLVTTTAAGHGNRRVRTGSSAARFRRAYRRRSAVGRGLFRAGPGSPRVFGVRRGRVRFIAVADRRLLRNGRVLRRYLRAAGVTR